METRSQAVSAFLGGWISTSVHGSGHKPPGDLRQAGELAARCVALAAGQDITRADLEAEVGDLDEHMRRALNIAQHAAEMREKPHPSRVSS